MEYLMQTFHPIKKTCNLFPETAREFRTSIFFLARIKS